MLTSRTLIRLDAAFELALGALLIAGWPLGWFDLAGWEGWPAALIGAGLVVVGAALWVTPATPETLRLLAVVNGAGALLFAGWLLIRWDDFDGAGALLVASTAAVLAILALSEWVIASRTVEPAGVAS